MTRFEPISIVIPTYNRASLLTRSLNSVLVASHPEDEIIVVDNGSEDNTEQVVMNYGPVCNVRYIRTNQTGAGNARNVGIEYAKHNWIAFADSDDEWFPDKLILQRPIIADHPEVSFIFSNFGWRLADGRIRENCIGEWVGYNPDWLKIFNNDGFWYSDTYFTPIRKKDFKYYAGNLYDHLLDTYCISAWTTIINKRNITSLFPEDVPMYEDSEFFIRNSRDNPVIYMDVDTAWQWEHNGSRLTDAKLITCLETCLKIISRTYGDDEEWLQLNLSRYNKVVNDKKNKLVYQYIINKNLKKAKEVLEDYSSKSGLYNILVRFPKNISSLLAKINHHIKGEKI